jgi:ABC-2 type transport system ATP-binding protein
MLLSTMIGANFCPGKGEMAEINDNNNNNIAVLARGLTKRFGTLKAVDAVDLSIRRGEIFAMLGTNGAGKTTTIKMLSCLIKPDGGTAVLLGKDIRWQAKEIKKIIGVSPQETAITGHLSIKENLMLMGGVSGLSKEHSRQRAEELTELMGLQQRREQSRKLSGGLQRRLSIAMAMMSDPEILFLDEPTLGLDPGARRSVWNYIERLKGRKTILLTTHYLEEADALADHIAIISRGNIIAQGTSRELKDRYSRDKRIRIDGTGLGSDCLTDLRNAGMKVHKLDRGIELRHIRPDLYQITDILRKHKVKVEGIHWKQPTLDEVFLKLTGEEVTS